MCAGEEIAIEAHYIEVTRTQPVDVWAIMMSPMYAKVNLDHRAKSDGVGIRRNTARGMS